MKVLEGTREITEDVIAKGMTLEITRDVAEDDKRIVKLMESIDNGRWKIINSLCTICLVVVFEIFTLLIFRKFKEKNKEEKMEK